MTMIRRLTTILAAAPLAWLAVAAPVHAAPPTNDNFASPLGANPAPGVPVVWTASTLEATVEVDEPQPDCVGIGKTVWYKIQASDHDRVIAVDTKGSDFDTVVAVYRVVGSGFGGLQQVDCADDLFRASTESVPEGRAAFTAVAGVKYRIQVGGCCSPDTADSGSLKVKVSEVSAPVNDDPAGAIAVTSLPTTLIGTTRNATTFPGGDPPPPDPELGDCFGSIYGHTVWYKLKFLVDTIVTVDTTGSDFDTVLAVYEKTGPDFGGLTSLGCNDDNIALESQVTFLAEAGKKYQIQVGGFAGDSGNLIISFSEGNPAGPAPAGPVEPVTKKKK